MIFNRFALSNLFSETELNRIQKTLIELTYFEIKMNSFGTDCFYLARVEEWITDRLTLNGYKSAQCFARLNTEKHDTSFRIHADSCSLDDSGKLFTLKWLVCFIHLIPQAMEQGCLDTLGGVIVAQ